MPTYIFMYIDIKLCSYFMGNRITEAKCKILLALKYWGYRKKKNCEATFFRQNEYLIKKEIKLLYL